MVEEEVSPAEGRSASPQLLSPSTLGGKGKAYGGVASVPTLTALGGEGTNVAEGGGLGGASALSPTSYHLSQGVEGGAGGGTDASPGTASGGSPIIALSTIMSPLDGIEQMQQGEQRVMMASRQGSAGVAGEGRAGGRRRSGVTRSVVLTNSRRPSHVGAAQRANSAGLHPALLPPAAPSGSQQQHAVELQDLQDLPPAPQPSLRHSASSSSLDSGPSMVLDEGDASMVAMGVEPRSSDLAHPNSSDSQLLHDSSLGSSPYLEVPTAAVPAAGAAPTSPGPLPAASLAVGAPSVSVADMTFSLASPTLASPPPRTAANSEATHSASPSSPDSVNPAVETLVTAATALAPLDTPQSTLQEGGGAAASPAGSGAEAGGGVACPPSPHYTIAAKSPDSQWPSPTMTLPALKAPQPLSPLEASPPPTGAEGSAPAFAAPQADIGAPLPAPAESAAQAPSESVASPAPLEAAGGVPSSPAPPAQALFADSAGTPAPLASPPLSPFSSPTFIS